MHLERPDGATISWTDEGQPDGPPVLLVMGLAFPAAMWFRLVPLLADRYRVLRLDNRGAGLTGVQPGAPYTVPLMAADALAVLDAAGVDQAHVVGISMGGLIAQELAATAPDRVVSLCLLATHPGASHAVWDPEARAMLASRGEMTPQQAAEASLPFNYAPGTPRERVEEDWAVRLPLAAEPAGYLGQLMGAAQWDGWDALPTLTAPTLVVHGDGDRLVPPANGQLLAERIPGARLAVVEDANHVLTTDQPERVGALVRGWLDGQA